MTPTPEAIRHLAATIGIGALASSDPNRAVLKQAHDALRAYADLLAQRAQETCSPQRASELCIALAQGTNGNVPIQSVFEAMLTLIGREDVIEGMNQDAQARWWEIECHD